MAGKVAGYGVLTALAFIFSYIEALLPFHFFIPGIKLGLANLVVVTAFYLLGPADAFVISILRIILTGFTFGNMYSMVYGLCGGLLSFLVMLLCFKKQWFTVIGVSLMGGMFHNIGQILAAVFIVKTVYLTYYLPVLLIAGEITGIILGVIAKQLIKNLNGLRQEHSA